MGRPKKPVGPTYPLSATLITGTDAEKKRLVVIIEQRLGLLEAWIAALNSDLDAADVDIGDSSLDATLEAKIQRCNDDPEDVGSAPDRGSSTKVSRCDHVHEGVHKVTLSADAFGDIVFAGAGVSQVGNTFTFAGGAAATFVDNENLDAQCDGVATVFTLAFAPSPTASLVLFVGLSSLGALGAWIQGVHYTLAGVTITKVGGVPIPPTGARMRAFYRT